MAVNVDADEPVSVRGQAGDVWSLQAREAITAPAAISRPDVRRDLVQPLPRGASARSGSATAIGR